MPARELGFSEKWRSGNQSDCWNSPRGTNEAEDAALADELSHDVKETAEHRMLVDLGRNDIGKIAKNGTVKVTKYMEVEYFRYVMQLTSVVKGQLLPELTALDALKSTLPAWNRIRST